MIRFCRRAILAFVLTAWATTAFAQAPPPVPALPDTDRVTTYSLSGTTCACAVNFALYGDSTDYQNWLTVYLNGVAVTYNDATLGWTITSPTGSLSTISRPITDAVLTFNNAQTGTVQIVGARRPRRVTQFNENRGVAARDLNQALTDIVAQNRETWDLWERAITFEPGFTPNPLPLAANRAGMNLCFDPTGQPTVCVSSAGSGAISAGNGITFTGTNPTAISTNITGGTGITVAPSGAAAQVSLANAPANTAKCNPTGSTAAVQDCTVAQLNTMGLAPSVFVNSYSGSHPLAQVDCNGLAQFTGAQSTVTLPAAATITGPCVFTVTNSNTTRGQKLSGFPSNLTSPSILYPGLTVQLTLNPAGPAWIVSRDMGPWVTASASFFVNPGGSNSNDGLATGTTNAFATLQFCINTLYSKLYDSGSAGFNCKVAAGLSITEYVSVFYPIPGSGITQILSDSPGTQFTWNCPSSLPCLQFGDYSGVGLTDISFVANASSPEIIFGHQYGVTDLNTNVKFTGASGSSPIMSCDYNTQFNFNSGLTYAGNAQLLFFACSGSTWNINNAITASSATLGRFFSASGGSHVWFAGNVTFPGSVSTSVGLISGNSVVGNFSGATLPGGTPVPTTGGQICTSAC
jgi:hypothetical protein